MTIHCRIIKLDIDRFQVDLTCRGSDLRDDESKWKLQHDTYYDYEAETADKQKSEDTNKNANRTSKCVSKTVLKKGSLINLSYSQLQICFFFFLLLICSLTGCALVCITFNTEIKKN